MSGYTIVMLIVAGLLLLTGILMVTGVLNPFQEKDAEGDREPLTRREKGVMAGFFALLILTVVNFFYAVFPMRKKTDLK